MKGKIAEKPEVVRADSLNLKTVSHIGHSEAIRKLKVGEAYVCRTNSNLHAIATHTKSVKHNPVPHSNKYQMRKLADGRVALIRIA